VMTGHDRSHSTASEQVRQPGRMEIARGQLSVVMPLLPDPADTAANERCCGVRPLEGTVANCALQIESVRLQF
jgi:hypothetical protein